MSWWQNLFNQNNRHQRVRTTGQMNATHIARKSELPVVVAPVTGQLQQIAGDKDQINSHNGFMMVPNGNSIMSPVSGIVVSSDAQTVTIQSVQHEQVTVKLQTNDTTISHLATYGTGQQLHAGDLIGTTHAINPEVHIYVLFEETVVPHVNYGAVYAGQNVWQNQESTDVSQ
ncbi:PTS sugar transporter subunit IIA [Leuconostoc citreum]|uniref:PTS sugar transporter subunit IIA n=1 Tax=Leuconostoc citreum TaxID=33964 RepID=UPI000C28CDB3|nr:PTS sugar transporter subunit IIA [Leuconostoc citreum]